MNFAAKESTIFFAGMGRAAALDQVELRVDLIRSVNGDIDVVDFIQRR